MCDEGNCYFSINKLSLFTLYNVEIITEYKWSTHVVIIIQNSGIVVIARYIFDYMGMMVHVFI